MRLPACLGLGRPPRIEDELPEKIGLTRLRPETAAP